MKVLTDNQHYQDIAEAILAKTGGTTPLKPAEMAPALNDLNIELEEAYVTSTEEEQIIYPDEGYYGFSKITVGAVDLSSGGSGGSGGGSGETYPDAESTTFGYEYSEEPIPTGYYYYGSSPIAVLEIPSAPTDAPYCTMFMYGATYLNVIYTGTPVVYSSNAGGRIYAASSIDYEGVNDADMICYRYRYDTTIESPTWELYEVYEGHVKNPVFGKVIPRSDETSSVYYNNFPIYQSSKSTEILQPTRAGKVPETINGVVATPVPRDDIYTISGDTLNSLIGKVQQITGGDLRTPSEAASALSQYIGSTVLPDTTE